jgi:hypothetical protein
VVKPRDFAERHGLDMLTPLLTDLSADAMLALRRAEGWLSAGAA